MRLSTSQNNLDCKLNVTGKLARIRKRSDARPVFDLFSKNRR